MFKFEITGDQFEKFPEKPKLQFRYNSYDSSVGEDFLDLPKETIEKTESDLREYESSIKRVYTHNYKVYTETKSKFIELFKSIGIKDKSGPKNKITKEMARLIKILSNSMISWISMPRVPNISNLKIEGIKSPITGNCRGLVWLWTNGNRMKLQLRHNSNHAEEVTKKSIELAVKKYNIDITSKHIGEIIAEVRDLEKEEFVRSNYRNGDCVLDCDCSECGSWTVGDHRCHCGNRRVFLAVDGDVVSGFSAYSECY